VWESFFVLYFLEQVEVESFSSVGWMRDLNPSVEAGWDSVFCDESSFLYCFPVLLFGL
jgi:hypothetical protein